MGKHIVVFVKKGHISRIEGLSEIEKDERIVANIQRLHEGDDTSRMDWNRETGAYQNVYCLQQ